MWRDVQNLVYTTMSSESPVVEEDDIDWADESDDDQPVSAGVWRVLVVDDDPEVHRVTELTLSGWNYQHRQVQLLHASSAAQAEQLLRENPDICVALVDVVMETEHAGLDLLRSVRESLGNRSIRLVLRTGQPGRMQDTTLQQRFPFDDYCQKAELTAAALRGLLQKQIDAYQARVEASQPPGEAPFLH